MMSRKVFEINNQFCSVGVEVKILSDATTTSLKLHLIYLLIKHASSHEAIILSAILRGRVTLPDSVGKYFHRFKPST